MTTTAEAGLSGVNDMEGGVPIATEKKTTIFTVTFVQ